MSLRLLVFFVISIVGLWVILWESRPRKLDLSHLTTRTSINPEPPGPEQ